MESWFWQIVDVNGVIVGVGQAYDQRGAAEQLAALMATSPLAQSTSVADHRLTFRKVSV